MNRIGRPGRRTWAQAANAAPVMPGMTGAAFAAWAHVLRPGLPILFMSGYEERDIAWAGGSDPLAQVISKRFSRPALPCRAASGSDVRGFSWTPLRPCRRRCSARAASPKSDDPGEMVRPVGCLDGDDALEVGVTADQCGGRIDVHLLPVVRLLGVFDQQRLTTRDGAEAGDIRAVSYT